MRPRQLASELLKYGILSWVCGMVGYGVGAAFEQPFRNADTRLTEARGQLHHELGMQRTRHEATGRWSPVALGERVTSRSVQLQVEVTNDVLRLTTRHRKLRRVLCEVSYAPGARSPGAEASARGGVRAQRPDPFPVDGRVYCYRST